VTRHDGALVGQNVNRGQVALPLGGAVTYTWYAGDLRGTPVDGNVTVTATPVEFGGLNLIPADRIKQGAKSLVGSMVIEPKSTTTGTTTKWLETTLVPDRQDGAGTRATRAQATVCPNMTATGVCSMTAAGSFRAFSLVQTKGMSQYYKDGSPVEHQSVTQSSIPEDSQDSSNMALNYGIEPMWFRFGKLPQAPLTNPNDPTSYASIANSSKAYSNLLLSSTVTCATDANKICTGDPQTPVFIATPGREARIHLTAPNGTQAGSTIAVHGHVWQRDPYVCPGEARYGLTGACNMNSVGSRAIGVNPLGFALGSIESYSAYAHFDLHFPMAGGGNARTGDYLIRDMTSAGNAAGIWSILRVK
jgi:manganese oxidase